MNEASIYELHIKDITIQKESNSAYPRKYRGLVEKRTKSLQNTTTAIDHIKELGITHIYLWPAFDHYSIDETNLEKPQFNWNYDLKNYNISKGSFSTNPFDASARSKEFKMMITAFHDANIKIVLDVVYNHTERTKGSNFDVENPCYYYYYKFDEKDNFYKATTCGNETASKK